MLCHHLGPLLQQQLGLLEVVQHLFRTLLDFLERFAQGFERSRALLQLSCSHAKYSISLSAAGEPGMVTDLPLLVSIFLLSCCVLRETALPSTLPRVIWAFRPANAVVRSFTCKQAST